MPLTAASSIQPGHNHYPVAKPKVKLTKSQKFKLFLWNPKTRKCMGRTPLGWAKLVAFYIVLYTSLAAIWIFLFYLFRLTISDKYPKWQLADSIIGMNPGVGYRPQNPRNRVESALIAFRQGTHGDYQQWIESLNNFLSPYENRTSIKKIDCTGLRNRDRDSMCPFDTSIIPSECSLAQNFSYTLGKPCVSLKLNRIYGWMPQPYETRPSNYPPAAPFRPGVIQITCEGQNDPDKEHIGPIAYYPQGIELKYYPYYNQPGYQSPFVMVQFKNPRPDVVIYVECKAWAKNIQHDRYNKRGLTSFEIFIERDRGLQSRLS
ncbi:hypothetical protein GZH46_02444, partial [Fragariocoptes setiger]